MNLRFRRYLHLTIKYVVCRRIIKQSDNVSWCSVSNINFEKLFNLGSGFIKTMMVNIQNPFWKNILNDWTSFCDCIEIEKTKDILDTPLWYNKKLINGHDFYINEWYRKGIRQVSDLLDDQGNIYDFDVFKNRFGVRDNSGFSIPY